MTKKAKLHRRHVNRRCCAYCGVSLGPRSSLPRPRSAAGSLAAGDVRTWDHVVPVSAGGRIQVPCCSWCNMKKGDRSLTEWLRSEALALRESLVGEREPDPDPMSRVVLEQLRNEDLHRIRTALEYHSA